MSLAGPIRASAVAAHRRAPFPVDRSWRRDPRRFGRAGVVAAAAPVAPVAMPQPVRSFAADLRLFAMTFLAGFLFVSILLA
jgi:hypothetical protein